MVHNDYTDWSGPQRLRDIVPDEAEDLLKHRLQVIQVWRATRGPILRDPLALCDARTASPEDFIAAERRFPDRVGEIYHIAFNTKQRWMYVPQMTREEAIVFKCYGFPGRMWPGSRRMGRSTIRRHRPMPPRARAWKPASSQSLRPEPGCPSHSCGPVGQRTCPLMTVKSNRILPGAD